MKEDKKRREEFEKQEEIRKKKEKEERIRKEFQRRMNPKTKEDFDLLYHALESMLSLFTQINLLFCQIISLDTMSYHIY